MVGTAAAQGSRYPLTAPAEHSFISPLFCELHIIYILEAYFWAIFDVAINIEGGGLLTGQEVLRGRAELI